MMFFDIFCYRLTVLTACVTMFFAMKFPLSFLKIQKKPARKTIEDYKQEILLRQGREQFKALVKKGLNVPVVLL